MKTVLLILTTFCLGCVVATAQSANSSAHTAAPAPPGTSKPELQDVKPEAESGSTGLNLKDAGPQTAEEAARIAARNLAGHESSAKQDRAAQTKDHAKAQTPDQNRAAADDPVVEFRPAEGPGRSSSSTASVIDKRGQSPLKRVHGELYGAKGRPGHATGESVGGTSKSRKTSVYVQSEQERSAVPRQQ